jgi:ATP-dependent RNA helicase HelY
MNAAEPALPSVGSEARRFADRLSFALDPFQVRALDALEGGRSVLVAAPTGAGKTVVGEFACALALATGTKAFYTTPIKALSNQKYRDLADEHGAERVGLLTGDRSINGDAPIVVMTTEVLRNMIYEASATLNDLRFVVLDEVHYLADRARGAVWEEVITQLRPTVQLAALSATVSNAEEFGDWLADVREGGCEVVIEERRPVPLRHHYFVNDRIHPTFVSTRQGKKHREHRERAAQALAGVPNPRILQLERQATPRRSRGGHRSGPRMRLRYPSRPQVVEALEERGWLPAIMFVFSRAGCERAADEILAAGIRLTNRDERRRIDAIIDEAVGDIPDEDLEVLGLSTFRDAMIRGVAPHHAGLVPAFKEAAERAFQVGLLRVVIATETLALGINMPAKSVVIERLEKFDGERHVLLTPGEYTQLTGRAGRRGIDPVGHAVVLYQRDLDFRSVAGLVGTRTYPLSSSFAPSYNMAVNLLRRHDLEEAERLLLASFAQFQSDRSVSGLARRLGELDEGIEGYAEHLGCELGDWEGYWELRRAAVEAEREEAERRRSHRDEALRDALAALVPGEVVLWPGGPRRGLAAVVGVSLTKRGTPLARVITEDRRLNRLGPRELDAPPEIVATVELPDSGSPRQPAYRGKVADRLRELPDAITDIDEVGAGDGEGPRATSSGDVRILWDRVEADPVHRCRDLDEHVRWQQRTDEVTEEAERLRRRIDRQTGSLVRQLHRILDVLRGLGYVDEVPSPTADGMRLARIYGEVDLLVAEALGEGLADGLDPAELAALCALFTYESRSDEITVPPRYPTPRLDAVVPEILGLADRIRRVEVRAGLRPLRELDPGFVIPTWSWAKGEDLDTAIGYLELTGGDFVRSMKQVADLVGQVRDVGGEEIDLVARQAIDALRRGVLEA